MLYIAENLKTLRKRNVLTQEAAAEMLGVSPQSVSKRERGDTLPDIMLLPTLANLYKTSTDALIGMDKINSETARDAVFVTGHQHLREGNAVAAVEVYTDALQIFHNDAGIMSDLAMALALTDDEGNLSRAIVLCERVLVGTQNGKAYHTTWVVLCFMYRKAGEAEKAAATARQLPHIRESREAVLAQLDIEPTADAIDVYLKIIAVGESAR